MPANDPLTKDLVVRRASLQEIFPLRVAVLRPGMPADSARFDLDNSPATLHVGAFVGPRSVACVTFLPSDWQRRPAWQLRGMAVTPELQRRGIGSALLAGALPLVMAAGPVRLMWCNARVSASAFYARHGWRTVSPPFELPIIGPHVRMTFDL